MKRTVGLVVASVLLAGCSSTLQDLENVDAKHADKTEIFQAPDQFPNLALQCIHGVAIVTNTRDYNSVMRVPELDDYCTGNAQ